jgi:exodeoxyribonuclease-5
MIHLTDEQKHVIKGVVKDIGNEQIITFGGVAGCGKSTISRIILDVLEKKGLNFCPCAFTGKATNVLRKKGMIANTIHSTIYIPHKNEKDETIWLLADKQDIVSKGIDGFLVDEASMVSKEIHDDLTSFGLPIIYVGDHGQLEPIGTAFNLMKDPRYKLETVHRNAGEIAHFAEHLRKGNVATTFKGEKQVQIVRESAIKDKHLASVDQIICAFNKTRVKLNERVRKEKKLDLTYIGKGEKIICLRNSKKFGLFNGMQGIVKRIGKKDRFDFISDGIYYQNIHYDIEQFGQETNQFSFSQEANPFDYAYCITAHKSQGDEFGSVIAYEQRCDKWDHVRWSYTVASRAKNSLIWIAYETYIPSYLN